MEKEAELLQSLTESFVAVGLSLLTCLLSLFLPSSHQLCPSCLLCVTPRLEGCGPKSLLQGHGFWQLPRSVI